MASVTSSRCRSALTWHTLIATANVIDFTVFIGWHSNKLVADEAMLIGDFNLEWKIHSPSRRWSWWGFFPYFYLRWRTPIKSSQTVDIAFSKWFSGGRTLSSRNTTFNDSIKSSLKCILVSLITASLLPRQLPGDPYEDYFQESFP